MKEGFNISTLPSPIDRYKLDKKLGSGIFGEVHRALDTQASEKAVAVKIQIYDEENEGQIQEEYKILRDFTKHPNLVDFYGVFCERTEGLKKIWFVLELCECGSVIDITRKLHAVDKKMSEEHIAFILKYTIKKILCFFPANPFMIVTDHEQSSDRVYSILNVLFNMDNWQMWKLLPISLATSQDIKAVKAIEYLHENKVMHRNIRCSNILINKDGEVKLSDFGLSCKLNGTLGKRNTNIGSPSWMAPEVVIGCNGGYGNRSDVWALGISTIEMADGKAPFQEMHPTRALFQIVRNPPPGLSKPAMWSNEINDFISECLEKNPEHRPFIAELKEHPYIQSVPDNDYHMCQELKKLVMDLENTALAENKIRERIIRNGQLTTEGNLISETMQVEDLAALEKVTEDNILNELQTKLARGNFTSFVGDILLILNPNTNEDIYDEIHHKKYECKSRSDNEPHIFAVADSAYQDALHHKEPQHIVFSGESKSGKSTNMLHALSHLTYLGAMKNNTAERIKKATQSIQAAISAATSINAHSTRAVLQVQVTYGSSGKLSGAIFWLYQLEKWRISSTDMSHANFDLVYYFYDAMEANNRTGSLLLDKNRKHRYLRVPDEAIKGVKGVRESATDNIEKYKEFTDNLTLLGYEQEDIAFIETVFSATLILGNVRFKEGRDGTAEIENPEEAKKVAKLLSLEETKFLWALLNYCLIERGTVVKRKHSSDEARDARDTLASALYRRVVDWMINLINSKLSFGRSVFGDKYSVSLMDMFGFECYHRNRLEQLIVNTMNEQLQFLYNQRIFSWEMQEEIEEDVTPLSVHFYDNKQSVDQLMGRPLGLFYILDEASRIGHGQEFIMSTIRSSCKGPYIKLSGSHEFSVAHFTGKVNYDAREMADKNKDFLPPEMIETMRSSTNVIVQQLFKNKLTKTGNLTVSSDQPKIDVTKSKADKNSENLKARRINTTSKGQFSQLHRMRTAAATYRATSLELLKQLSIGPGSGGTHFVRCIRPDLNDNPKGFQSEIVRQQLRALAILDTAKARQNGFSTRIPFAEFIRRYRFLAFDFDENVEVTKDNCRLLLIRLKMEGWMIGKTKVFLKYYNEEYLSRLYEVQVKKVIKVQCMMRAFLVRRRAKKSKSKMLHIKELQKQQSLTANQDEAALLIQKAYRGYIVRKAYGPLISKSTGRIDEETARFLKRFAMKWKSRSIFQVLLQYRAIRYQDLVHFSQQVHIYNQAVVETLLSTSCTILLDRVDPQAKEDAYLGCGPPTVWKLPFRIDQLQYYDTSFMCDPTAKCNDTFASVYDSDNEQWDEPLKRRTTVHVQPTKVNAGTQTLINQQYSRDPTQPVAKLPPIEETNQKTVSIRNTKDLPTRPAVYKKKHLPTYQPPTAWTSKDDSSVLETAPKLRKTDFSRSLYGVNGEEMPDPIKELQALAKANEFNKDDPPFNFQAMLKKTPRNRASMKRSGESDLNILEGRQSAPLHILGSGKKTAPQPPMKSNFQNDINEKSTDNNCLTIDNKYINKIMLVPGIMIEGTVVDL